MLIFNCEDTKMDEETKNTMRELVNQNELLRDALHDCSAALEYIKKQQGELPGVAYDRALDKAKAIL